MQGFWCILALCRNAENKRAITENCCAYYGKVGLVAGEIMQVGKSILATSCPCVCPQAPGIVLLCVLTSCVQHPTAQSTRHPVDIAPDIHSHAAAWEMSEIHGSQDRKENHVVMWSNKSSSWLGHFCKMAYKSACELLCSV